MVRLERIQLRFVSQNGRFNTVLGVVGGNGVGEGRLVASPAASLQPSAERKGLSGPAFLARLKPYPALCGLAMGGCEGLGRAVVGWGGSSVLLCLRWW